MYCSKCGKENDDNAYRCTGCGELLRAEQPPAAAAANIPNYLVQAILVTLFCCMPFGVAAIVYAAQVNTKAAAGDLAGARASADLARKWCWWSFGLGLAGGILYILFAAAAGMA